MPPMRAPRIASALLCLLASGVILASCGDSESDTTGAAPKPSESQPAPPKADFPSVKRRTLRQVLKAADGRFEGKISPLAEVFYPGMNRFPFEVLDSDQGQIVDAEIALYFARVPPPKSDAKSKSGNRGQLAKAQAQALDQPAVGPFPAKIESLATKPAFQAKTTSEDPDAATIVYSSELDLPKAGEWKLAAILREDGELMGTTLPVVDVGQFKKVPKIGDKAPLIHTPSAGNKVDYAEALGKEPIVLLFATPEFCQSRVCGPVVDVAEQAKHEYGDEAAFIQMEIYKDNDPAQGVRPQVRKFHLPTEPFLFTIDRSGVVADAVEGAFGLKLMHEAVDKAIAG